MKINIISAFILAVIISHGAYSEEIDFEEILNDPNWANIPESEIHVHAYSLIDQLLPLIGHDTQRTRNTIETLLKVAGIKDIEDGESSMRAEAIVFLLNRIIWNIPVETDSPHPPKFGGFVLSHEVRGDLSKQSIWPFSFDENGKLRITGAFGGYGGKPYDGLAEYDYLSKRFHQRNLSSVIKDFDLK